MLYVFVCICLYTQIKCQVSRYCDLLLPLFKQALMACEASRDTVKQVQKCPLNEDQWREAARRKKCEEIVQNCSGGHEFVYHCLINSWGNETVEVCALRANIIGTCTSNSQHGSQTEST